MVGPRLSEMSISLGGGSSGGEFKHMYNLPRCMAGPGFMVLDPDEEKMGVQAGKEDLLSVIALCAGLVLCKVEAVA